MTTALAKLIFMWCLLTGIIQSTDNVDDRPIYEIPCVQIKYAYKGEIIEYIKTGTFKYDEDLED